jgi:hypothetical protein
MIDDILFLEINFLEEVPIGPLGGDIIGFSMEGNNYNFIQDPIVFTNKETAHIYIS